MEIREGSLFFPTTSEHGPQVVDDSKRFPRKVLSAVAAIVGYSATFANQSDHHLGRVQANLETITEGSDDHNVTIRGTFGLRDSSGDWDDPYTGTIQYVVLAELAPVGPGGPGDARGDLIITDLEVTQAIQIGRAHV